MTQTTGRLFDDLANLMTSAAGAAQGVKNEIDTIVKGQMERFMSDMDIVRRDEFEAVFEMAQKARQENAELRARIEDLERRLAGTS
ncbi:MAG: accessory factor UbiK family protein [Hyphomicrobiaceae bacterium]